MTDLGAAAAATALAAVLECKVLAVAAGVAPTTQTAVSALRPSEPVPAPTAAVLAAAEGGGFLSAAGVFNTLPVDALMGMAVIVGADITDCWLM